MARDAVLASRVQANMLMLRMNVKEYLISFTNKVIKQFNSYYDITYTFVQEAKQKIQSPSRVPLVLSLEKKMIQYKIDFNNL